MLFRGYCLLSFSDKATTVAGVRPTLYVWVSAHIINAVVAKHTGICRDRLPDLVNVDEDGNLWSGRDMYPTVHLGGKRVGGTDIGGTHGRTTTTTTTTTGTTTDTDTSTNTNTNNRSSVPSNPTPKRDTVPDRVNRRKFWMKNNFEWRLNIFWEEIVLKVISYSIQ